MQGRNTNENRSVRSRRGAHRPEVTQDRRSPGIGAVGRAVSQSYALITASVTTLVARSNVATGRCVRLIDQRTRSLSPELRRGLVTERGRLAALAAVAMIAMGVGGAAAAGGNGSSDTTPAALTSDVRARLDASDRADRSARTAEPTPSGGATTAPQATAKKPVATKKPPAKAPAWVVPMAGAEVTSCYGQRWGTLHAGIDFARPAGAPIRAVGSGTVFGAGWIYSGYGISVVVKHPNGYLTHYAHMSATKVKVGQQVKTGQTIGYEGSTGDSTGPHLHFEVHKGMWNRVDPAGWLSARGINTGC